VDAIPETDREATRKKLGVAADAKVILCVARLIERKGQDVLLQAFSKLQSQRDERDRVKRDDKRDELVLVLIGSGEYGTKLHALAELLGVTVRWEEQADDDRVRQWYAAADVFCLPARERTDDVEGFGIVFLEAAVAGLPVIAGKGWGTGEAVVDGVTGLLVDPSPVAVTEALEKLLNDDALRLKLGQAGKERALHDFKWSDRWTRLKNTLNLDVRICHPCESEDPESEIVTTSHLILDSRLRGNDKSKNDDFKGSSDIAVIIPCYNHAKELVSTLEALCKQTLMPAEVVVVDNGSDDDPGKVVEAFKDKLPIAVVRFTDRRGGPAARNEGFRRTVEPFVMFLDADTRLAANALADMREALQKSPKASFAYSDFYWGRVLFRGRDWNTDALKQLNWIHTSALVRRAVLNGIVDEYGSGPFDESLKKFQDWDLWLTLAERGFSGVWIPEVLFKVVERKTGMSRWVPAFVHRIPWPVLGWTPHEIVRYREAERVIREKHRI